MSRNRSYFVLSLCLSLLFVPAAWTQSTPQETKRAFHWPEGKRVAVSLSFDDSRASQVDIGMEVINPTGVKVTFYVNPPRVRTYLEGWKRVVASGHEIGSHTVSHPCQGYFPFSRGNALDDYTLDQMSQQLEDASAQIQQLLGVRPVTFAYPCGAKVLGRGLGSRSYVPLIAQKFILGRGTHADSVDPMTADLAEANAIPFDDMDYVDMVSRISQATQRGDWVIFLGHDIGHRKAQTTDTVALAALLKFLQNPANGVWVDTVEHVAKYVLQQRASLEK